MNILEGEVESSDDSYYAALLNVNKTSLSKKFRTR